MHAQSYTTGTVHLGVVRVVRGKRVIAQACGVSRLQTAALHPTEAALTCEKCQAKAAEKHLAQA